MGVAVRMKMSVSATICAILAVATSVAAVAPLVSTGHGRLRGIVLRAENGRNFSAFLGIPYAVPPVGNLRFSPPVQNEPWPGILNATRDGPVCLQRNVYGNGPNIIGSEDCLYLNIYVPKLPYENDSYPYPVMIWIHGGSWQWWSGTSKHFPPARPMNKDTILVTINYRLGWLGFLSTEDKVVRGNNGLKDQAAAIKWVKSNIASFGGDSNRITLDGHGAGAASVHLHLLSPLTKDLITSAIIQSGSAFDPRTLHYPKEASRKARALAVAHSCPTKLSDEMIACLRRVDAEKIASSDLLLRTWNRYPDRPLRAVVEEPHDGAFLVEHPESIVRDGNQARIPIMVGGVADEGALYASAFSTDDLDDLLINYRTGFPAIFAFDEHNDDGTKIETSRILKSRYFVADGRASRSTVVPALQKALTVRLFESPMRRLIELQHGNNTIYAYRSNYRGNAVLSKTLQNASPDATARTHYDDLPFLFDFASDSLNDPSAGKSRNDQLVTETVSELWYNFVTSGDPTPEVTSLLPTKWKPIEKDALDRALVINGVQNLTLQGLGLGTSEEERFWEGLPVARSPDYRLYLRSGQPSWRQKLKNFYDGVRKGFKSIFG